MPDVRETLWEQIDQPWDVIVIGGGITGAGILYEAASLGWRALLLEARDFSFGTSSRSGKFVHGGIRYLRNWQFSVSYDSVREREKLIRTMPDLVTRQSVDYLCQESDLAPTWRLGLDLTAYELFAGRLGVHYARKDELAKRVPELRRSQVRGAYRYSEGLTDDSRLVLRVLDEAGKLGGKSLNYAPVISLLRQHDGRVVGVLVRDDSPEGFGRSAEVKAGVVINATGYYADELRSQVDGMPMIRRSRGSHLIFPLDRLPVPEAICYYHPDDQRIQFVVPWQGVLMVGTTDLDYSLREEQEYGEPRILPEEVDYILRGLNHAFPDARLTVEDIQSSFCGVRPLVSGGAASPSKESRRHILVYENGLITITGGKLTTFRLMAHEAMLMALQHLDGRLDSGSRLESSMPDLDPARHVETDIPPWLAGRYGETASEVMQCAHSGELEPIGKTPTLWAELRWIARRESVVRLEDLMLRHTRLGLTLSEGGLPVMDRIRSIAGAELNWDEPRWTREIAAYQYLWRACYFLPI
jgi:glycerol-3-phosphate dehydrogenase